MKLETRNLELGSRGTYGEPVRPKPPAPTLRRGVSLMEVLISTFVISIGLLSLAALIPVGLHTVAKTTRADMTGACGRAGLRDVKIRGMLDYRNWEKTSVPPTWWSAVERYWEGPPEQPVITPFAIDPLGVAKGMNDLLGGSKSSIPRLTMQWINNVAEAEFVFRSQDDLVFAVPEDPTLRPTVFDTGIQYQGNYSWFITVVPDPNELSFPLLDKKSFIVSVVVCYQRDLTAEGENAIGASIRGGYGGCSVELDELPDIPGDTIQEDDWIFLFHPGSNQYHWYRVVRAGISNSDGTPTMWLSLTGPDWDTTQSNRGTAVILKDVMGVYTETVSVDRDSALWWSK